MGGIDGPACKEDRIEDTGARDEGGEAGPALEEEDERKYGLGGLGGGGA